MITKTNATPYRRFQDPTGIIFIPWTSASVLGTNGYDIHDIVGDTVSLTQDDADRTEIPHEFSDDPLDENVSLGNKNLTMQCLDFQNIIMKNLFGYNTDTPGFAAAPAQYKDLYCCVILQFEGKSVVMPRVKMDSKTTLENMRTDIARGELSGVLYTTDVKLGSTYTTETGLFFMDDGKNFTIGDTTVSISDDGDVTVSSTAAADTVTITLTAPSHGSVEGLSAGANDIPTGDLVYLTATPDAGYNFTKFTIGTDDIAQNPVAFRASAATTVSVTFTEQ